MIVGAREIERHKTAIPRSAVSAPVYLLQSGGVITDHTTVLDYGCGQGHDVEALKNAGISAKGWDPHFSPDPSNLEEADVVNLGFVLNVIEDRAERIAALEQAFSYARQCLSVSVMLIGKGDLSNSRPYKDGFITSRNTFQKYYTQPEFREFLCEVLGTEAVAAGPGIFFIFKDEVAEQRFLFRRQVGFRQPVSQTPRRTTSKKNAKKVNDTTSTDKFVVAGIADTIREIGRHPDESELSISLKKSISRSQRSLSFLINLALQELDTDELERAAAARTEELTLFFALNAFGKRAPYRDLPSELQRDVRAFFGSHQRAIAEGRALLFSIGDEEKLRKDAADAVNSGMGRLDDGKFQFNAKDLIRLPITLRGYVAIGERLAGDLSDATLFKIHLSSKKLTALHFPDFDTSSLPRLEKRVKIEFPAFDVQLVDHTAQGQVKLLYLRSNFLPENHPHFAAQKRFDDRVSAIDGLSFCGEGPPFKEFLTCLSKLEITPPKFS
ncbi:DNA phosphorothioation-associated putative methyltransferase [Ruegeria arenilitoris]|uniref:DNA phosphorothioation-associated putative methyltransferase n=1 Tax=Ruegeria arenilitoris TaxID=1173585 RepID=UPI001481583D|nr:DNA phosphorothioation-associated putative methyltransferase [Ruegeria arenilitoris]